MGAMRIALLLALILAPAAADTIHLADGRTIEGTIEKEETDRIKVNFEHGGVWIDRKDIVSIESSPPAKAIDPPRADPPSPVVSPARAALLDLMSKIREGDAVAAWHALHLDDGERAEVKTLLAEDRASLEALGGSTVRRRMIEDLRRIVIQTRVQTLVIVQDESRYGPDANDPDARAEVEKGVATIGVLSTDPYRCWFEHNEGRVSLRAQFEATLSLAEKSQAITAQEASVARAVLAPKDVDVKMEEILDDSDLSRFRRYDRETVRPTNEKLEKDVDDSSRAILRLVNDYRRWMGLRPLRIEPRLVRAALAHSEEEESLHYFSHHSPTAALKTPADRARVDGFESNIVGENLAQGDNTPAEIFEAWQRSPGHHQSLLNGEFSTFGAGRVGESWTLMFGGEPNR